MITYIVGSQKAQDMKAQGGAWRRYREDEDWRGFMIILYFVDYEDGMARVVEYEGAPDDYAVAFPGGLTLEQIGWQLIISMATDIDAEKKDSTDFKSLIAGLNDARTKYAVAMDRMHRIEQRQEDFLALLEQTVRILEETGHRETILRLIGSLRRDFKKS